MERVRTLVEVSWMFQASGSILAWTRLLGAATLISTTSACCSHIVPNIHQGTLWGWPLKLIAGLTCVTDNTSGLWTEL